MAARSALITGAASGIGADVAAALAAQGVRRFLLLDLQAQALRCVGEALSERWPGVDVEPLVADVSDRAALQPGLRPRLAALGRVDVLVNSAGIGDVNQPEDERTWHRVLDVNLHGAYRVIVQALPHMGEGGRIVNVASVFGRVGHPRNTAYCAAKHALVGLTRGLAMDLAPQGITVNAVLPASVDTPMYRHELATEAGRAGMDPEGFIELALQHIPIARFVQAGEVAGLVAYLASPQAAAITAQCCIVDGGQTCGA